MIAAVRSNLDRWNSWRTHSAGRRLLTASLTVATLTVVVKVAGAAKLIVIAHRFGTGDALDAFLIAFVLPSFLAEVLGASFNIALLPALIEVREHQGAAAARTLMAESVGLSLTLLAPAAALLFAGRGLEVRALGSGFDHNKLKLCESLLATMTPLTVLMGVSAIWRGVLNAGERFAVAAGVPTLTPLVTIGLLLWAGKAPSSYVLAAGTLAGTILELAIVGWAVRAQGFSLLPRWTRTSPELRQITKEYAPVVIAALVMAGSLLIDPAFAAALGRGSVSALTYGTKLASVILAIGPAAIATAALPHFSRMAAYGDWTEVRNTVRTYSRWIVAAAVPITIALVVFSEPIARILFEKGAFTRDDTLLVAAVQRCALLQLPFAMLGALLARLVSSLRANRILMWAAGINLCVNTGLDAVFMRWWGVAGIALSSAVVALVSCCFLVIVLSRLLKGAADCGPQG